MHPYRRDSAPPTLRAACPTEDPNADENVSHFSGVPGGVAIIATAPKNTTIVNESGIKNLRKYTSLITGSIYSVLLFL